MSIFNGVGEMDRFINREPELRLIEDAIGDLLNTDTFLRTPIIDFFGIDGIGKTSILKKIVQTCDKHRIRYIWADASKNVPAFFYEIIDQAQQYSEVLPRSDESNLQHQSVAVTQELLKKGPLVILLDAVDATNEARLVPIEEMLNALVINNKLFVVLTSSRSVSFEHERDVARKLSTFPLLPLDRDSSEEYLESLGLPTDPELRNIVFEWTHGYPLAMDVMVQAIREQGIDPRNQEEREKLLGIITQRVIDQRILARVEPTELQWFQRVLRLLSVPRRFNLLTMQSLIEQFAHDLKLANSLAYIVLPNRISQSTDVLSWNLAKGGFAIDSPIRNMFLLQLKIGHLEDYYKINRFLAEINQSNAKEVSGPDRIRYQREYLYHMANSGDEKQLARILTETVQQIIKDAEEAPELLIQFREEFIQDTELKELLGKDANLVLSLTNKHLAQKMYRTALQEEDEEKRIRYYRDFFDYTIHDPVINDLPSLLEEYVDQLIAQERPAVLHKLYENLAQDDTFRKVPGKDFAFFFARLLDNV